MNTYPESAFCRVAILRFLFTNSMSTHARLRIKKGFKHGRNQTILLIIILLVTRLDNYWTATLSKWSGLTEFNFYSFQYNILLHSNNTCTSQKYQKLSKCDFQHG